MPPFTRHTGRMVPLRRSNVDTDQIIPSEFCRRLTRDGFEDGLFAQWRREDGFVLDRPERAGATVLVARSDFGTGSSREPAVWALLGWGFRVVVAESFGGIFHRNACLNGLLPVTLPAPAVVALLDLAEERPALEATVDLVALEVRCAGERWPFELPARPRRLLLEGLDAVGETLLAEAAVERFERARPAWLAPVVPTSAGGTGR